MARELLQESDSDSESTGSIELKINQDFAARFEHNKKREELQKLEEKHGNFKKRKRDDDNDGSNDDSEVESSSDSEDEDDAGHLATATLDGEIFATIQAIKSKDPRVYDGKTSFYTANEDDEQPQKDVNTKPMYLRDYHRENLLNGFTINQEQSEDVPMTYNQEQAQLKKSVIDEMNAAVQSSDTDEDELLVAKIKPESRNRKQDIDVQNADRDPETFLSNFMASRAWIPTEKSAWQPFESDDEDDERRADEYEEAYNMRFEDPKKSNETLRTHARDMAARYSVRRDEKNARNKKREAEKQAKETERQQRKEEKARLRKLRIEEVEDKVRKIKHAAGLKTSDIQPEDWSRFVDEDWDDEKWEEEMQKRFGEGYYAQEDAYTDGDEEGGVSKKRKTKKPKFDDEIDINDIVPDFKEDDVEISLSDEEPESKGPENHKKLKQDKKKDAKKERRIIEQLVDDQLQLELDNALPGKSTGFRYRETSPHSFGMTARDILMADDSQLNQFVGLKKLAAFRDVERKQKDKKRLGKKARLRQWRKDTFGHEDGLQDAELVPPESADVKVQDENVQGVDININGKKNKRRSKKRKSGASNKV